MKLADCVSEWDKQLCLIMVARDVALIINLFFVLMLVLNLFNAGVMSTLGEFAFLFAFQRPFLLIISVFTVDIIKKCEKEQL